MAAGDFTVAVVPATSALGSGNYITTTNPYGETVTITEKDIGGDPALLQEWINLTAPANSVIDFIIPGPRLTFVFRETS